MPNDPVPIRHPPHTRRARQFEREQARAATAGRRRAIWTLVLAALAVLMAVRPRLLLFVVVALALGMALRWALLSLLPEERTDAGSSRGFRRRTRAAGAGTRGLLSLLVVLVALVFAVVWLAGLPQPETPDPWLEPWGHGGLRDALVAVAFWPPLPWIVLVLGLLLAGSIRRALFRRRTRYVLAGEPRDGTDGSEDDPPRAHCPR